MVSDEAPELVATQPLGIGGFKEIDRLCKPDEAGENLLKQAISRLGLSARAYHRILKLARTIADLAAQDHITSAYIGEAIQYRRLDRSPSG